MKKIILIIFAFFSIKMSGQSIYTDYPGKWRIGINVGAMWQNSDVTPHAGIAGGFNIERILNKKADAKIGFSLGFRYLSGNCTGLDIKPSSGVVNNNALNGTYDSTINYSKNGGYFYNNYKSYIHEGALELKINFPRFEQKTNLIFHIMGGIGICNYKTWINALDANGNMYDFASLQNMQNVSATDVKRILNGSYSTLAQGSSPGGTTLFAPSIGVGFGFKLSRHVALVFEYRASFPSTNLLDGVTYNIKNEPIRQNDFYNYASANLLFTIFGRYSSNTYVAPVNNTVYTQNTQAPVNTYVPVNNTPPPVNPVYNQQPIYTNQQAQGYPPYVNIFSPTNNYSSPNNYISVKGNIQNIQSFQQISISQNGYPIKYFTYDPYTTNFHFQTFLQQGLNNIIITANSPFGTGSQGLTIFYNPPYIPNNGNGVHTYNGVHPNNNGNDPYNNNPGNNSNNNNNGNNPYNNNPGNNTINTGNLNNGIPQGEPHTIQSHTLHETENQLPVQLGSKPIIQYISPSFSPDDISTNTYNIIASIQNIAAAHQVTVSVNGNSVQQFNYNTGTKELSFTANLLTGYNSVNIVATNTIGTDSKSTVIDYKPVGQPPRIDISNPSTASYTSQQPNIIVSGYVYNVTSSSDIKVLYNGNPVTFSYNNNTHEIEVPVNLTANTNQLNITATNAFGNDEKQVALLLSTQNTNTSAVVNHTKPVIAITSPASNPYTSMSGVVSISANIDLVTDAANVSVTYNGTEVSFSYNPHVNQQLNFTSPLKPGDNTFIINAKNGYGTVSKNLEINYVPTNPNGNVNGNPSIHFTGGVNNTTNIPRGLNTQATQLQPIKPIQNSTPGQSQPAKPILQNNGSKPIIKPR